VSPIDSEGSPAVPAAAAAAEEEEEQRDRAAAAPFVAVREEEEEDEEGGGSGGLDLRLSLRGRDGRCVVMELDSAVLLESSAFFADLVPGGASGGGGGGGGGGGAGGKRIEVDGVDNLEAFKEAVELMFEPDAMRWLARAGVSRAIAVLEVSQIGCTHFFVFVFVCADSTVRFDWPIGCVVMDSRYIFVSDLVDAHAHLLS
jgi:hypothetical protein